MTRIGGKRHPRKPEWVWMLCDSCFQNFWSDAPPHRGRRWGIGDDVCEGCRRSRLVKTLDDVVARIDQPGRSDRQYHGAYSRDGK